MIDHPVVPPSPGRSPAAPVRRWRWPVLALALAGSALLVAADRGADQADAAAGVESLAGMPLTDSASATQQAVRTGRVRREFFPPPGKLPFPADPVTYCSVWRQSFGRVPSVSPTGKHEGTDIMVPGGNLVFAVESGVLVKRYTGTGTSGSGYGWTLRGDSGVFYRFFHMATDDLGRVAGDRVEMGDVLGYVGDTGTTARNFHLHFEVRPNDSPVDPLPLLDVPAACTVF